MTMEGVLLPLAEEASAAQAGQARPDEGKCVMARSASDEPSSRAARATRASRPPKRRCAKVEAIQRWVRPLWIASRSLSSGWPTGRTRCLAMTSRRTAR